MGIVTAHANSAKVRTANTVHTHTHDCKDSLLILHLVVVFFFFYRQFAALLTDPAARRRSLLNSITHSLPRTSLTLCPRKQQRHRRANLLSMKGNWAALTKEDQGWQRNVSGLGIWRVSVAIALPSRCFTESRFPPLSLSLLRFARKRKNERCGWRRSRKASELFGFFRRVARLSSWKGHHTRVQEFREGCQAQTN